MKRLLVLFLSLSFSLLISSLSRADFEEIYHYSKIEDLVIQQVDGDTKYVYISFDLSQSNISSVLNSNLSMYRSLDGDDDDILVYFVPDQNISLPDQSAISLHRNLTMNRTLISYPTGIGWVGLNTTNITKQFFHHKAVYDTLTFRLEDPDRNTEDATTKNPIGSTTSGIGNENSGIESVYRSSEHTPAAERPFLTIRTSSNCKCVTSGDWKIQNENCVLNSNCKMDGSDFVCSGAGTLTMNANITGWGSFEFNSGCNLWCNVTGCFI